MAFTMELKSWDMKQTLIAATCILSLQYPRRNMQTFQPYEFSSVINAALKNILVNNPYASIKN